MAKKKASASSKKTTTKKTGVKKKKAVRKNLGKGTVVYFMGQLISAGYLGEGIPEEPKAQNEAARAIRTMAERLARQTLKHGEGDVGLAGAEPGEGDED